MNVAWPIEFAAVPRRFASRGLVLVLPFAAKCRGLYMAQNVPHAYISGDIVELLVGTWHASGEGHAEDAKQTRFVT